MASGSDNRRTASLTRRRCANPDVSRFYRAALFGLFLALAVFGLVYAATSNNKLYWVRETIELARPFGPYVNPTNFAAVMELADRVRASNTDADLDAVLY